MAHEVDLVFLPIKHAWKYLAQSANASVILVGSTAGVTGSVTNTRLAHTASKGAVVAMTKQLAAEGCPGSGEALRLQGLTAHIATEEWAAACVDYLETIDTLDADRIGLVGWSLGGYYAPRAAAFAKAWGANHDWGKVQRRRVDREGEHPVPHYWEHVMWVWGHDDLAPVAGS